MILDIYQVDAFTHRPFGGNPAAVCPLPHWLDDATLQRIAEVPEALRALVIDGAEGNPFYMEELVKMPSSLNNISTTTANRS